ncbi:MAG: TRAP transporter substrate-binding protein [Vannielia sp.]|uniref:TRAP transporter substrate-binding protein n=1 Tax=Vannielia sp. TaxID=2813045 RepID=UPI003B8C8BEB
MKLVKSGLAALLISAAALPAAAETNLLVNSWLPPTHSMNTGIFEPWFAAVEEATGGEVKMRFTDASLGAPPRQFDLAVDGIVDISFGVTGYTPGRFALPAVSELPQMGTSGEALSVALWRTHQEYFAEAGEFDEVVLLGFYCNGTGHILSTEGKGAVTSMDDYRGTKFRVGGGMVQEINTTLGGVNVAAPAGEIYEILEQGVADGVLLAPDAYTSFALKDVIAHDTIIPGGFYTSAWFVVMNRASWDGLSPEVQEQIMSVSGEALAKMAGAQQDAGDAAAVEQMKADGVEIIEADEAFMTEFRDTTAPLHEAWIAAATDKGVDGQAAFDFFRAQTAELEAAE